MTVLGDILRTGLELFINREALKIGMPMELTLRVGGHDKEGNEVVVYKWRPKSS